MEQRVDRDYRHPAATKEALSQGSGPFVKDT